MQPATRLAAIVAAFAVLAAPTGATGTSEPAPGLDGPLLELAEVAEERGATAALELAQKRGLPSHAGLLRVVVAGEPAAVRAAVLAGGGEVSGSAGELTEALVPPAAAAELAEAAGVTDVRPPLAFAAVGTESEGVAASQAPAWHGIGAKGAGARVAIVDTGFATLQSRQVAGELPSDVVTVDYCDLPLGGGEPHGTAVAEIVHEVAPEAKLYAICVESEVDLANAVAYAKANGITVVNHSVVWFNTSRGDGSGAPGTPDALVADARAHNILWVNSAGNSAQRHWHGPFTDVDDDGRHEFAPSDETNVFSVPAGRPFCAYLKWDRWPATSLDLSFSLLSEPSGTALFTSDVAQRGSERPAEGFCWTNGTQAAQTYALDVRGPAAAEGVRIDLFVHRGGALEHQTPAQSVLEPASSASALAVAAICWQGDGLEPYSSRGPTLDGRLKPDIAGPVAVTTATYGGFAGCGSSGFVGTSAAAPHVAGAAALLRGMFPLATAGALQEWLEADAADLGSAGKDVDYGAGKLRLPTAPPDVTTGTPAAAVAETSETLDVSGLVSPKGVATTYRWEYGTSTAYGSQTSAVGLASPRGGQGVAATLTGLQPDVTYHYRLVATSAFGTAYGVDRTQRTAPPLPPLATTGGAQEVGSSSARLDASVLPRGTATSARFEWGTTSAYGSSTSAQPVGASGTKAVSAVLGGLAPDTEYHYRVVAVSSRGTAVGEDGSFRTAPAPPPPPPAGAGGGGSPQPSSPSPQTTPPATRAPATPAPATLARPVAKTLRGGAGPNTLRGGSANDRLYGGGGNDRLAGGAGSDRLYGGPGADRLYGGAGADRLDGGPGRDVLEGGSGADVIAVRDGARDSVRCGPGRDSVTADRLDVVARDCERVTRPRAR